MNNDKLRMIINHYGFDAQFEKLKEEMTELAYFKDEQNMKEEIADVLVVLKQLILFKGWQKDIEMIAEYKINRQLKRMED